jgi:hypothetical protein
MDNGNGEEVWQDNRQSVGVIRAAALYTHTIRRDHEEKRLKEVNFLLSKSYLMAKKSYLPDDRTTGLEDQCPKRLE